MRVGIIGINHKLADLKLREQLAKVCQRRFSNDSSMHGENAFVLLSTCNRTEIYFFSDDLPDTHSYLLSILRREVEEDFDQKLYSYFGFDCFLHLARVASGLDSAIIAETEIQGQVKAAYETALIYSKLPYELHFIFQKSLKIGKQVRSDLPLKPGLPDLEHAIQQAGAQMFPSFQDANVLFIGASDINIKIIAYFKSKGMKHLTVCNRTAQKALEIARQYSMQTLDWTKLPHWVLYDWVVVGTKAVNYILKNEHAEFLCSANKLVIDLCVPRNVDPLLGRHPLIELQNIDQINRSLRARRQTILATVNKAENLVLDSTSLLIDQFHHKERHKLRLAAGA